MSNVLFLFSSRMAMVTMSPIFGVWFRLEGLFCLCFGVGFVWVGYLYLCMCAVLVLDREL